MSTILLLYVCRGWVFMHTTCADFSSSCLCRKEVMSFLAELGSLFNYFGSKVWGSCLWWELLWIRLMKEWWMYAPNVAYWFKEFTFCIINYICAWFIFRGQSTGKGPPQSPVSCSISHLGLIYLICMTCVIARDLRFLLPVFANKYIC